MFRKETIDVARVAEYIFKKNVDSTMYLEVNSLKTTKELFFFLFDIFCKGLILMFGEQNQVELNTLTAEQFAKVGEKLRYAHIKLCIDSYPRDTAEMLDLINKDSSSKMILDESLQKINESDDNESLESYRINILMDNSFHQVSFSTISY